MIHWPRNLFRKSQRSNHSSTNQSAANERKPSDQSDRNANNRTCQFETMEARRVLSANPVTVGAVYIEDDSGTDGQGDQFYVSFEGGSATTKLSQVVINTSQDGNNASLGEPDVYFDTIPANVPGDVRGSGGAHGFNLSAESVGVSASDVSVSVVDGGTQIVLDIEDFTAGDVLVFSIDVDQFFANKPDDQITSGIEFAGSQLETVFVDDHFNFQQTPGATNGVFQYTYNFGADDVADTGVLSGLPSHEYRLASNGNVSIENRTAGARDELTLTPKPVTISGTVYHDRNLNLTQEAGEEGIAGVLLQLQVKDGVGNYIDIASGGQSTTTTLTDADGNYTFDTSLNLQPGTYRVIEVQPTDFEYSVGEVPGTVEGTTVGSSSENVLAEIEIPLGDQHGVDYDFAEAKASKISGYVYHDRNNDGVRDAGEEGLAGVQIQVSAVNSLVPTTPVIVTTDANGYYCVEGLPPGEYEIMEMSQPTDYLDGLETAGTIAGTSIGTALNPGDKIVGVTLLSDQTGVEYNFGEIKYGTLSGYVFLGTPAGDCVGPGHPEYRPIAGVEMQLTDANGNTWNTFTDAQGKYEFTQLAPGTYTLVEVTDATFPYLNGDVMVGTINGASNGVHSSIDTVTGIAIGAGDQGQNYNFCEHEPASLSGNVYHDRNNNGLMEAGEEGIAGVTVELFRNDGTLVQTTVTDAQGAYSFTDLYAGTYRIVETQPATYVDGIDTAGTIDGQVVGRAASHLDRIRRIDLLGGQDGIEYNFGEYRHSSIEGWVHTDLDGNCLLDTAAGEQPIAGVTIELLDDQGNVIASTTSDANGHYYFDGLAPGNYSVQQIHPNGYFEGGQVVGQHVGGGAGPGDASVINSISQIVVQSDTHLTEYNFCEIPPSTLSGYVFQDGEPIFTDDGAIPSPSELAAQRDGQLTSDDTGLSGVVLELRNGITGLPIDASEAIPGTYGPGPIRTVTDASGFYQFVGLPAGNYAVFEIQPAGYVDHIDTAGTTSGIPVNPITLDPFVLQTLDQSVDHNFDAILRIALGTGQHSQLNNFSEVVVRATPDIPPVTPPPFVPPRPDVVANVNNFLPPPPYTYAGHMPVRDPGALVTHTFGVVSAPEYTWHLSVIDAGIPRGQGFQVTSLDDATRNVGFLRNTSNWQALDDSSGRWIISFNDASQMQNGFDGKELSFGVPNGIPVVGDFNGDGIDEVAMFQDGHWFIDLNGNGEWDEMDLWARLGDAADRPVVGDWDGDGKEDIGIFGPIWPGDPRAIEHEPGLPDQDNVRFSSAKNVPPTAEEATQGRRVMRLTASGENRVDVIDHVFSFGDARHVPIAGDWNGDGIRAIGVFHEGSWKLDADGDGRLTEKDIEVRFGQAGDIPVFGDFNGDGIEQIGVFRNGQWILDSNNNREFDAHDAVFEMGQAGDIPLAGDFDGDGIDEPILYQANPGANPGTNP